MNSQKIKKIAAILLGFSLAFFLGSCGTEEEAKLGNVSDKAQENSPNILGGRGEIPAPPKKDDKKEKPSKDKTPKGDKPVIEKTEDTEKEKEEAPVEEGQGKKKCGDGRRAVDVEECDDGNQTSGDGCSSSCRSEADVVDNMRTSLDVGYNHVCFIDDKTRQVKCWGNNAFGQLAQGNTVIIGDGNNRSLSATDAINIGNGVSCEMVAASGDAESGSTCIINSKSEVKCFGSNKDGQLGIGSNLPIGDNTNEIGIDMNVVKLGKNRSAIDIDGGARHHCVLLDNSDVKCWGLNDAGQLGQGSTNNFGAEEGETIAGISPVPFNVDVNALSLGAHHSCVITATKGVRCFGLNSDGQLGQDSTENIGDAPEEIADLTDINLGQGAKAIAAGYAHTCALLDDGSVKCWGKNNLGQLGQNSAANLGDEPGEMAKLLPVHLGTSRKAKEIVAGDNFTCALLDNGSVKCWGDNAHGQLGQNSTTNLGDEAGEMNTLNAINLGKERSAIALGAGGSTTCALLDDHSLKCFGANDMGQLGQGGTSDIGDSVNEMASLPAIKTGF